jgi:putative ABC transport system permease protein
MWSNIFKIVFRNLRTYKLFSFINIVGLSLGLTVFILIYLYVKFEFSYDTFHKNYENIYRVEMYKDNGNTTRLTRWLPYYLSDEMVQNFPEIINRSRAAFLGNKLLSNENKTIQFNNDDGYYADDETFDIFTYNILEGNKKNILTEPFTVALSKSIADKLFPNQSAIGRSIFIDSKESYIVNAVYEDIPKNSHFDYTFLVSMSTYEQKHTETALNNPNEEYFCTYLLLNKNTNIEILNSNIKDLINNKLTEENVETKIYLKGLPDIHFYSGEVSKGRDSDIILLSIYCILGIFTLLLALLNYMNLTTAFSTIRAKEIGIRKVVGANKLKIAVQFIAESVTITFISLLIAIVLVEISLPTVSEFTRTNLRLHNSGQFSLYLEIFSLSMLVAIVAGSYPAFHISKLKPIKVLKGTPFKIKGGSFAQKAFVFFQFFIAILFLCFSLVMFQFSDYLLNKSMGFEKDNVLVDEFHNSTDEEKTKCQTLINELSALSCIEDVCTSVDIPSYINRNMDVFIGQDESKLYSVCYSFIDDNFFNTYEIPLKEGRNFYSGSSSDLKSACIVNETFLKEYNISDPIGKNLNDSKYNIIGVVKDFHFRSFGNEIQPLILFYEEMDSSSYFYLSLQTTELNQDNINEINKAYGKIYPERMFNFKPFNNIYDRMMLIMMKNFYKLITYFTIITIFIAVMGLFALVLFTINKRFKEIGVRKVMGATSINIFKILSWDILKIMVLANIVGIPLSWYLMNLILSFFPYKIELGPGLFATATLISFSVVILIMIERVYKASISQPIDAIKYE